MRNLTISVTAQQSALIKDAVENGDFGSESEVVQEALRLLEQRQMARLTDLARLKQAYDEGIASGEGRPIDAAALLADVKDAARRRG